MPDIESPLAPNIRGFGIQYSPVSNVAHECFPSGLEPTLDEPPPPCPQLFGFSPLGLPPLVGFDSTDDHSQTYNSMPLPALDFTFETNPFEDLNLKISSLNLDAPPNPTDFSTLQNMFPRHSYFHAQCDDPSSSIDLSTLTVTPGVP